MLRKLFMMRRKTILFYISFLFIPIFLCLEVQAEKQIKIGVILPLTGDMAAVGAACRDAIRMALEDSQDTNKFKYKIIIEDDRLIPIEVAKAAQKLISIDKVSAIISTWSYGGQIVAPLAERAKIPHIGVAWDHRVADGDYSFLHLTPPSEFMKRFLEVFKKLGTERVALLGIEESGSVFALDEFIRMAPDYGVKVVFRDSVLWDITDFNSIVSKIIRKKPDYLLYNLGGENLNISLLKSLKNQQVQFEFTAITSFDVIESISWIEGKWYVSDSYLPKEFAARFQSKYGHSIRYGVGNFYEAMRLHMYALEKAGGAFPKKAKNILKTIKNLPSIFGPTSVDRNGIFNYPAKYMRIENGKRVLSSFEEVTSKERTIQKTSLLK